MRNWKPRLYSPNSFTSTKTYNLGITGKKSLISLFPLINLEKIRLQMGSIYPWKVHLFLINVSYNIKFLIVDELLQKNWLFRPI